MASRQPAEPVRGDLTPTPPDLRAWCVPLQKACELEAERGFGDLRGRADTFSGFVRRSLSAPPAELGEPEERQLAVLRQGFDRYEQLSASQRQRLVCQLRQGLHALQCRFRPPPTVAPPRLRLLSSPAGSKTPADGRRLEPSSPLGQVPGIGPKTATRLAALGLFLVEDLLRHYPRDYLNYAHLVRIAALEAGGTATVVATVRRCTTFISPKNPNLSILELQVRDCTGHLRVTRFFAGRRFASPGWLKSQARLYPPGCTVAVSGLVRDGPRGLSIHDPLIEVLESPSSPVRSDTIGRLVPVYALTEGLTAETLRQAIARVLPLVGHWPDPLPAPLRAGIAGLLPRTEAVEQIHRPSDPARLQQARRRLVFDEFLLLQLALGRRRERLKSRAAPPLLSDDGQESLLARFLALLPFPLTAAQSRVLAEIRQDLAQPQPMARLLQGDVGSGKTVVALAALLTAIESGCQGALMAPTEVLAEQHLRKLAPWLDQLHISSALLTGSTPTRRRRQLLRDLINGQLHLLVGTHALLEDPVQFERLGLVVVDEQHRFGVRQRNRLLAKGLQPHLLTMTATPIPRTLALSVHGDLDVSQIDELPPGRTPVRTRLLREEERPQAWRLIREQVALGQRAYVVLPLVEDSEKLELRSAVEVHRQLAEEEFADLSVGLLHGRLSSEEKQRALEAFATGATRVLVSTTVVEVGVDVPEASVMVIEHAERFGLAQLHQLRGRVGRGAAVSHCLLIHASGSPLARQRLEVLVRSSDGFEIAEMDLRLRGPGQMLGTAQSGLPDLALASLSEDGEVLEDARRVARQLLERDPALAGAPVLRQALEAQRQRFLEAAQLN
ncbi:MAG: ATP-dependent DNA helicase RecG [Cyanobacteria bacterium K_Offshore_surface_m2_239]|nr:ATP-dependent DNA helicase RecG [Cyanobacteria bacterium K_Offshore_surface_m2_239]